MSGNLNDVKVGDEVYVRGSNERWKQHGKDEPPTVTITKVGPKRVCYKVGYRDTYASKRDGRVDDWTWLQTKADYALQEMRSDVIRRLRRDHHIQIEMGYERSFPTGKLVALLAVMDESADWQIEKGRVNVG